MRAMCNLTEEKLIQLLKEAETTHAEYEKKLGKKDEKTQKEKLTKKISYDLHDPVHFCNYFHSKHL